MKEPRLQCAVVGIGHIGKRHVSIINAHPDFQLKSVCDLKFEATSNHEGVNYYQEYTQMLEKETHINIKFKVTTTILKLKRQTLMLDAVSIHQIQLL